MENGFVQQTLITKMKTETESQYYEYMLEEERKMDFERSNDLEVIIIGVILYVSIGMILGLGVTGILWMRW